MGDYRKGDMSATGINQANVVRQQAKSDAQKAEKEQKAKLNAEIANYFASQGVNTDKTKTITRIVDGKETEVVFGSNKDGKKIYIDANTGKEVVVTESKGKNQFTTKDNLEAELTERFGMTSKDLSAKGIVAEYKHGKITLTDIKRGNRLPEEFLAQLETKYKTDLAKNTPAKTSESVTMEEYFDKMQAYAPQLNNQEVEIKKEAAATVEKAKMPTQEELEDSLKLINNQFDLAKAENTKRKNANGVVVQGASSKKKISRGKALKGKGTVSAADQAKIDAKKAELKQKAIEKAKIEAEKAEAKKLAEAKAKQPKKIITTSHHYERGVKFSNGNSIEAEDKNSVWDSDALFSINGGKYNLKSKRSGMMTRTLDYGDLKSDKQFGLINDNTGKLNPESRIFESQYDRNAETLYFSGKGELNGAQVLKYKNKVAVCLNGKYYDLNTLIQTNRKEEIK